MSETLFHAYTLLVLWMGLGLFSFRFLPDDFPRLLGRSLYWVGVPLDFNPGRLVGRRAIGCGADVGYANRLWGIYFR